MMKRTFGGILRVRLPTMTTQGIGISSESREPEVIDHITPALCGPENKTMSEDAAATTAPHERMVLLRCPFCGEEPHGLFGEDEQTGLWRVECFGNGYRCGDWIVEADSREEAAQKWNDRADAYPIFDVLPRLWAEGYKTKEQDGEWWLFRADGEGVCGGSDFRGLCVNIILAGI